MCINYTKKRMVICVLINVALMSDGERRRVGCERVLGGQAAGPAIESQVPRGKQRGRRSNYIFSRFI